MAERFEAFTIAEFEALMPSAYLMDDESKGQIVDFMREHCASRPGMMQLIICVAEMCGSIVKMIQERDGTDHDFVMLEVGAAAAPEDVTFGRIITATLNADADMQVALIRSMLDRAEQLDDGGEVASVAAECFGLFSFLMHELVDHKAQGDGNG